MRKVVFYILFVCIIFASPVLAKEIHVDPYGNGDFTTISAAYSSAGTEDVIILAPAEYKGDLIFSKKITLRGQSPELRDQTIVAGTSQYTIGFLGNAHGSTFKDLTVTHTPGWMGCGFLIDADYISIINCQISGNVNTTGVGGAVEGKNFRDLLISDCDIHSNSSSYVGGAMLLVTPINLTIANCQIHDNFAFAHGGVVQIANARNAAIKNTEFYSNQVSDRGGAMYLVNSDSQCVNCKFIDNTVDAHDETITDKARGGALYLDDVELDLINCVFQGNSVTSQTPPLGGAVYCIDSSPNITNCTFHTNSAKNNGKGGAMYNSDNSDPVITNCIFRSNNSNGEIVNNETAHPGIRYSLVYGSGGSGESWDSSLGYDLGGNIDGFPYFISNDDLHLNYKSPCIDAGRTELFFLDQTDVDNDSDTNEWVPIDIDGDPRFSNALHKADQPDKTYPSLLSIDMGAYEYQGLAVAGLIGDLDGSGIVDLLDFQLIAGNWLKQAE